MMYRCYYKRAEYNAYDEPTGKIDYYFSDVLKGGMGCRHP